MENIAQKKEEDQTRFFTEFGPHGNETQKKQTTEHYKSRFSNTQKKFFVCCY
jgi:recombinational DNA repair ATPase RecF